MPTQNAQNSPKVSKVSKVPIYVIRNIPAQPNPNIHARPQHAFQSNLKSLNYIPTNNLLKPFFNTKQTQLNIFIQHEESHYPLLYICMWILISDCNGDIFHTLQYIVTFVGVLKEHVVLSSLKFQKF